MIAMSASENLAYMKDDTKENDKTRFGSELNIRSHLGEEECHEAEIDHENNIDTSRIIVNIRSSIYEYVKRHNQFLKRLFYIIIHTVLIGYLAAASKIYLDNGFHYIPAYSNVLEYPFGVRQTTLFLGSKMEFWKGYGLLIVLYCLLYGGLFYYLIVKRYFLPKVQGTVWKRTKSIVQRCWKLKPVKWFCCAFPLCLLLIYVALESSTHPKKVMSLLGLITFVLFGFIFSESPGHIKWRPVYAGFILQFLFGLASIKWNTGRAILQEVGDHVAVFLDYTKNGTIFVYGPLVESNFIKQFGLVFAFSVLPVIFFFSFFVNILSYYNILQWFVLKLAWIVQTVMGTTVCESVNAAASIFLGQTESVLLIKDHLKDLTKSEFHAIMCEGLSTVAGSVLAAYISFGISPSHLIAASVMSAPAALSYSKLFYPEKEESKTTVKNIVLTKEDAHNVLDAACKGALTAITLVSGIIANIIAFLAFVSFLDGILHWFGILLDYPDISFQDLLAKFFLPVSYLMGVDDDSVEDVARLVGIKTFVNEFQAYESMAKIKHKFTPRTEAIATYALCGFSNFGSIGILVGGLSALEPSKSAEITSVAMRSFIAGNIVCFITACVAGTLLDA